MAAVGDAARARASDAQERLRALLAQQIETINAARVAQRVMEGGHDVPISRIVARYSRSLANCVALLSMSDRGYVYDNSVDGADARLLYRTADGRVAKVYGDVEPWAQSVLNALAACGADDVSMKVPPERPERG